MLNINEDDIYEVTFMTCLSSEQSHVQIPGIKIENLFPFLSIGKVISFSISIKPTDSKREIIKNKN